MSSNTEQTQQEPQQAQQQQQTDEHNVPLWILSPSEEKTLLKEHQTWTESMCDKQFAGTKKEKGRKFHLQEEKFSLYSTFLYSI